MVTRLWFPPTVKLLDYRYEWECFVYNWPCPPGQWPAHLVTVQDVPHPHLITAGISSRSQKKGLGGGTWMNEYSANLPPAARDAPLVSSSLLFLYIFSHHGLFNFFLTFLDLCYYTGKQPFWVFVFSFLNVLFIIFITISMEHQMNPNGVNHCKLIHENYVLKTRQQEAGNLGTSCDAAFLLLSHISTNTHRATHQHDKERSEDFDSCSNMIWQQSYWGSCQFSSGWTRSWGADKSANLVTLVWTSTKM